MTALSMIRDRISWDSEGMGVRRRRQDDQRDQRRSFYRGLELVDEAHNEWGEIVAIRSDGTLWVANRPTQPQVWQNGQLIPQPAVKLIKFGMALTGNVSSENWEGAR